LLLIEENSNAKLLFSIFKPISNEALIKAIKLQFIACNAFCSSIILMNINITIATKAQVLIEILVVATIIISMNNGIFN
jgi:hypothetical protein